ncbi:MAG: GNAT family N-acetyltransferase, partial [Chitinophagaceae bacterium]
MFIYTTATSRSDLEGILALQKKNLPNILTPEEIRSQGFVTVMHSFIDLENLNNIENHVIARHQGVVIAYLLAMTRISGFDIPLLQPMFEMFSKVSFSDKKIAGFNYLVVGQVCVDKKFRGQGVLDSCYAYYKKE